jgi:acyl carrier protein
MVVACAGTAGQLRLCTIDLCPPERSWFGVLMDEEAAQRVVCEYLSARFGIARERLTSAARFQEDLGLDSFEVTEVLLSVEDETGIDLGLAYLTTIDDVTSIGALAAAVSRAAATPAETRKP